MAAVRRYDILDTPPDGTYDRVAALVAQTLRVPIATVTIVDEDRIWFKAAQGLPQGVCETSREPGLCASAILHGESYVVPDALRDSQALTNPLVRGELGLRFYAAAPITTADGFRLGTVNAIDTRPRKATDRERGILRDLAAMVMDGLELRLSAMRTVQLERELQESKEANLRAALDSRAGIDQAIGVIMAQQRCGADEAFAFLSRASQNRNVKLRDLAAGILTQITTGPDPAPDPPVR
ncbi:GAF domain-containing protein [Spinactinospora alkalitolerans]|uniref:GAF domain-containing protein n=1 Tax=Spinactinospora alkalitolerans TaxID=687207 RepID=A0A852TU10_9ACTN|nr:GAF and ANTAR domain-containing protein [Spinactinospora alkalitolerans]NYE47926.1 GAF domain-containing protein [Spinactinospora alkalitolerans]